MSIDGIYEIVEMELWDKDAIDLVEPGYISIKGKKGKLHFICVDGQMEIQKIKDKYLFTWEGNDECDPASGYGDFTCIGDTLTGRIYIHGSDDSTFVAVKAPQVYRLPKMVNRAVLIIKAKEPFRKWISELPDSEEITINDINMDCTAYLIPEYDDDRQRDRILKNVHQDIFEGQLNEWCTNEDMWPQKRTFAMFKKWFELEYHPVVDDLGNNELDFEEY